MESLLPVFRWVIDRLKTVPEKEDNSLPEWIRATESYKKGLYSFDGPSGVLILRFAYYLGESFIRCHTGLKWSMGNRSKMQRNMPVISGFKSKMELPVLVVSKKMFASAIENKHTEGAATAITAWRLFT